MLMCDALIWLFDTFRSINWLEVIKSTAPVVTASIAFAALKNWQRQDKAKRESEFLDLLIEATHTYIAELPKLIILLEIAKMGMASHVKTWEIGEQSDKIIQGAIAYIGKYGERDAKRLLEVLEMAQPSVIKLRSLIAKGQMFEFDSYSRCQKAIAMLTAQFDIIEASTTVIGSPDVNWENPMVLKNLKDVMVIEPAEMRKIVQENNISVIEFARAIYQRIYS